MKLLIFSVLLITVSAGPKDKKTTLEDIEREYLSSEKKSTLTPPPKPKVATPAQSPTQFGFVPKKTIADYVQQGQRPLYLQPQYTQQYTQQPQVNDYSQYATSQQYTSSSPKKINSGTANTQYSGSQQKYPSQIYSQPTYDYVAQIPNQLQSLENVQYITDNSINGPAASQYYTPQYYYIQQYSSPSTAVQTVVEPKGALQYVMYVPTYVPSTAVADQTVNYENVVYTGNEQQALTAYQQPETPQTPQYSTQYVQPKEQVQYIQPKTQYPKEYVIKREPKSLLDSYIPSIVQLQYYRQAQQNSVQEPVKVPQTFSRKEYNNNSYRPEEPSSAETSVTYKFQPSSYRS